MHLLVADIGEMPYAEALELQRAAARARISGVLPHDLLILVEHPPVVTLGRNAKEANLTVSRESLAAQGVDLFEVERGGDVTFHGPGQLVGYPIFDLKGHRQDLHWYLRALEQALIDVLRGRGIYGFRSPGQTGVWTDGPVTLAGGTECPEGHPRGGEGSPAASRPDSGTRGRKIASIGVHAREWVTWHGFALNVSTELRYFDLMVPCGIPGVRMTSIATELGVPVQMGPVKAELVETLAAVFGFGEVRNTDRSQLEFSHERSAIGG
jgi:lipoyl(octanoyl) transferase